MLEESSDFVEVHLDNTSNYGRSQINLWNIENLRKTQRPTSEGF